MRTLVLSSLALAVCAGAPIDAPRYGVFRM